MALFLVDISKIFEDVNQVVLETLPLPLVEEVAATRRVRGFKILKYPSPATLRVRSSPTRGRGEKRRLWNRCSETLFNTLQKFLWRYFAHNPLFSKLLMLRIKYQDSWRSDNTIIMH